MTQSARIVSVGFVSLLLFVGCSNTQAINISLNNIPTQIYFSPRGGAADAIVKELGKGKTEILVQAYSFTHKDIANALVDAKKRGLHVEIILDKSNISKNYSAGDFTSHMGIPTYIDAQHAIAHNKIIIIDGKTVITGSFNFTRAADEKNAENLIILKNKDVATIYMENWEKHKKHSQEYQVR